MAKCSNCGANLNKKTAFCPSCGNKVERTEADNQQKKGVGVPILIVLVILALVVGVGAGFVAAQAGNKAPANKEDVTPENINGETEEPEEVEETEAKTSEVEEPESKEPESKEPEVAEKESEEIPVQEQSIEGYNYVSIGDEVRQKEGIIYNSNPEIYSIRLYNDNIEWSVEGDSDFINRLNYSTVHFMKAQPNDIRIIDGRFDGGYVDKTTKAKYSDDFSSKGGEEVIPAEACYFECGNVIKLSGEYLSTLDAGLYEFEIYIEGKRSTGWPVLIMIHDESEEIVNYRPQFLASTGFYSTESKNDVIFYMNGAVAPIKDIIVDYTVLDDKKYDLICDGYGFVLHPEFLEKYTDNVYLELLVRTENDLKKELKVVFLNHAE